MRRLLVVAALVAAGCGAESAPQAPEDPKPLVLATFNGEVDSIAGTFTIQAEPTALGQALGMSALIIPSGTPGVTVANAFKTPPTDPWNNAPNGCGTTATSGATVRVTSNYSSPTVLAKVYAEITSLTPMTAAACNSELAPIPGVTAANGGLWSYGDLSAGAAVDRPWAFTFTSGVRSTFKGRIVAFRVDAWTAVMPSVDSQSYRMAGTGASALFIDSAGRRIVLVDASGTVTQSAVLSAAPTGVGANGDGSQIWVALGSVNRIARLDATGALVGTEIPITGGGNPEGVAVDPNGVVWSAIPNSNGLVWYDPNLGTQGRVTSGGGTGSGVSPIVAVNQGGTCLVYTGTRRTDRLRRINCTTKASLGSFTLSAACGTLGANRPMVAGANGDVWLVATSGGIGQICKIIGTTSTASYNAGAGATFSALAYGPDANLWAMHSSNGLCRIWLGATSSPPQTCLGPLVPSTLTYGIASGAGAVWAPKGSATAGRSDLTRVIP
jgi:streptogramin lyase